MASCSIAIRCLSIRHAIDTQGKRGKRRNKPVQVYCSLAAARPELVIVWNGIGPTVSGRQQETCSYRPGPIFCFV